ncbi:MAG: hypothetical protein NC393_10915 [Clostridium sp.]|nr:hypothetical protein [Clostridium sp.]MCM1209393.1 hypothetical protein [Ruminococcus sp.]
METDKEKKIDYRELVEKSNGEIPPIYDWIYQMMNIFIKSFKHENRVIISRDILDHVVVDYFVDIDRLKEFSNIEQIHHSKIFAYLAFWILRHKPLQVIVECDAPEASFVNEEFVCYMLRSYFFADGEVHSIVDEKREDVDNFVDNMLYYFQYRDYSAKSIEIMILAFKAGCGYQYSIDHHH